MAVIEKLTANKYKMASVAKIASLTFFVFWNQHQAAKWLFTIRKTAIKMNHFFYSTKQCNFSHRANSVEVFRVVEVIVVVVFVGTYSGTGRLVLFRLWIEKIWKEG